MTGCRCPPPPPGGQQLVTALTDTYRFTAYRLQLVRRPNSYYLLGAYMLTAHSMKFIILRASIPYQLPFPSLLLHKSPLPLTPFPSSFPSPPFPLYLTFFPFSPNPARGSVKFNIPVLDNWYMLYNDIQHISSTSIFSLRVLPSFPFTSSPLPSLPFHFPAVWSGGVLWAP